MSRRNVLLLPVVLAAITVPVAPAFAGEDDGEDPSNTPTAPADPNAPVTPAAASLRSSQGCMSGSHAKAVVTGEPIESVLGPDLTFTPIKKRLKDKPGWYSVNPPKTGTTMRVEGFQGNGTVKVRVNW